MEIREAVIQGLIKVAGSDVVDEAFRDAPSALNERMNLLAEELVKIYGKVTNNYGCFDQDQEIFRFPHHLQQYLGAAIDIVQLSQTTSRLIAVQMGGAPSATGGYALYLRYENQGRDWLLIVMLKLKTGTGIDEDSLELNESLAFDINHLHEAARIDLAKWQANEQPYLSFIKRSGRQDEVTRYFRLALGCTEYTDSKSNTDQALKAVDAYAADKGWTPEQKREARRKTYEYFDEKSRNHEPVNMIALSGIINDQEPDSFTEFVKKNEFPVSETFEPHRKTYTRFKRISEKFGNVNVSFDVQDVLDGRVDYDAATENLVIGQPPVTLIKKINQAKGNDAPE